MSGNRLRNGLCAAVLVLAAGLVNPAGAQAPGEVGDHPWIGAGAPRFELVEVGGKTVTLTGLRGKYAVIHFGTSWRPFCNAEAPHLQALADAYADQGVVALVIDTLETKETVVAWKAGLGWTIPVLLDTDGEVSASYAPAGVLPELPRIQIPIASNLISDREGRIQFYSLLDSRNFDAKLESSRRCRPAPGNP
jgi:thiol-disulfide isomerase/thioredoxin